MHRVKIPLSKVPKNRLLPLIAASAVIRNDEAFCVLIKIAKIKKIPFNKIYETLLQNYLFAGYPVALVSLKILKENYPDTRLSKAADMNLYHFRRRGKINLSKIYGEKSDKLIENVKAFSPDLAEWFVLEGYGKVLGRKGLSFKERELCVVAVLTVLGFGDQLYSHIIGAFRANASIEEIKNVIENVSLIGNKKMAEFVFRILKNVEKAKGMCY